MEEIWKNSDRSKANVVVVPSAPKVYMSGKIPYVYRQQSDFFYLTGCLEPEVVLVLVSPPGGSSCEAIMFMPQTDSHVRIYGTVYLFKQSCIKDVEFNHRQKCGRDRS